jgi:hypothetical protein
VIATTCPGLSVAFTEAEEAMLTERAHFRRQAGAPIELISGRAAQGIEPGLADGVRLAGHCPIDGFASAFLTGRAFRLGLADAGVTLLENAAVSAVAPGFTLETARGSVAAKRIVLAGGVWLEDMAAWLGVNLPIKVLINQLVVTERLPPVMRTVLPSNATAQPIWRNAASMTRVSSESSRSCKVVVPWHKAANNNTRLEMLFEPGSVTVPWALVRAGTSRKAVLYISVFLALASRGQALVLVGSGSGFAQLPSAAGLAGLADQRLQCRCIALGDGGFELLQGDAEVRGLRQHLLGIGQKDVAPNGWVTCGNARKISETRTCQL